MKYTIISLFLFVLLYALCAFNVFEGTDSCYITFHTSGGLTAAQPDRLPESAVADKYRILNIGDDTVHVSTLDGYRILYNNVHGAPFINMKVELSDEASYEQDKKHLHRMLQRLADTENIEVEKHKVNGFTIFGVSDQTFQHGSNLATYIMFPKKNIVVYFYFNNLREAYSNVKNLEDFRQQRDFFFEEYTAHLTKCN